MGTESSVRPSGEERDGVALLIIDVQQGLFRKRTPIYKAEELLRNIRTLIDRAHRAGIPVCYVQHSDKKNLVKGSDDWRLHPQLVPLDTDLVIHKHHGNAFQETSLGKELEARNVGRLVVTGLVTHGCVRATCVGARELGYEVVLVEDGHSSYSKQAARLIEDWNEKLGHGIVELRSTQEIDFGDGAQPTPWSGL
jgi:nicotinamidase-related amidase